MTLLHCLACDDLRALSERDGEGRCSCGHSSAEFEDGTVTVHGPCRVMWVDDTQVVATVVGSTELARPGARRGAKACAAAHVTRRMLAAMSIADGSGFGHEAMLYDGRADFIRRSLPFIRDAINAKQPVLVAVDRWKIDELRRSLGADAAEVRFEDMVAIGGTLRESSRCGGRSWTNTRRACEAPVGSESRSGLRVAGTNWSNASVTKHC